jgi:hypothetical protein
MTDDQMPAQPATVDGAATERPTAGTEQGEAAENDTERASGGVVTAGPLAAVGDQGSGFPPIRMRKEPRNDFLPEDYVLLPQAVLDGLRSERVELRAKLKHPVVGAVVELVEEGLSQHRRAEAAHDLKDEANNRWLAVVAERDGLKSERDGLRRKVDAVRAWLNAEGRRISDWGKTHNPECECETEYVTHYVIGEIRKLLLGGDA